MKLSRLMVQALTELCELHTVTEGVRTRKRSLDSLARRGLAEYLGTDEYDRATYRITEAGKRAIASD